MARPPLLWTASFLLTALAVVAANVSLALWVYYDATARGAEGASRGVWALFPPYLLWYLFTRDRLGPRHRPIEGREAIVGSTFVGLFLAVVLGSVLAPPDPFTQSLYVAALVPVGGVVGYLLIARGGYARLKDRLAALRSPTES